MVRKTIEERIKEANNLCPYTGSYVSSVKNDKNRISLPKEIKAIFRERNRIMDVQRSNLICFAEEKKGLNYVSFWDYMNPEKSYLSANNVSIKSHDRIGLPKSMNFFRGELVFIGEGDHFEVYNRKDLEGNYKPSS